MYLLVTKAEATLEKYGQQPQLGRLVQPRHYDSLGRTVANGRVWAADNDCFQGLDAAAYRRMVEALPVEGCRFVTVPDVVADHAATVELWSDWSQYVKARGLPAAFVLQDGCRTFSHVPSDADALFVGGTTVYKMSEQARTIVTEAKQRGMWVHMGRVNTARRIVLARSWGCDSVDGSSFSMFSDAHIPWALQALQGARQLSLTQEGASC